MSLFATYEEQLATWFAGKPEHHGERGTPVSRCVPDFSCCRPELLSPVLARLRYIEGSKEQRRLMVDQFMRRVLEDAIHIPGVERIAT
jgi:hypothetical protein